MQLETADPSVAEEEEAVAVEATFFREEAAEEQVLRVRDLYCDDASLSEAVAVLVLVRDVKEARHYY